MKIRLSVNVYAESDGDLKTQTFADKETFDARDERDLPIIAEAFAKILLRRISEHRIEKK